MDVGLALPYSDASAPGEGPLSWGTVRTWATRAEELGFASVWLPDHLFAEIDKYGAPAGRHDTFDPLVALAALARLTRRVRLGTLVLCSQLREPTVAAKIVATLDLISGGRVIVGLGAGWQRSEYEAAGIPFEPHPVRLEQLGEAAELMARLLAGDHVSFDGRHYSAVDARFLPHPAQRPRPPIWVGGRSDGVIDVAARVADGWNVGWAMTPETFRARRDVLLAACERHGRDPDHVECSLALTTLVGEDDADVVRRFDRLRAAAPRGVVRQPLEEWRAGRLVGTVEQVREQLAGWEELGVTTVIASVGALPFSVTALDDLDGLSAAFE